MGLLKESDWMGDMAESLRTGLQRWVSDETLSGKLRYLTPHLFYTDAIYQCPLDTEELMRRSTGWEESQTFGAFSITVDRSFGLPLELPFAGLSRMASQSFFWSVYAVLCRGLSVSVGCAGARWAQQMVWWWGEWSEDDNQPREPEEFAYALPHPLLLSTVADMTEVERIQIQADSEDNRVLYAVAARTKRLKDALDRSPKCSNHMFAWKDQDEDEPAFGPIKGAVLFWNETDQISKVWDDYEQMNSENGGWDHTAWMHCWQPGNKTWSIHRAAVALRWTLEVMGLCDQLMGLLHEIGQIEQYQSQQLRVSEQARVRVR